MMSLMKKENLMADKVKMGAGGVPYKVADEPKKEEVISEVLTVNPNKKEKKEEKKNEKL